MIVVLDATTLISLGTIGELNLLTAFSGDLVVLPAIDAEVTTEPARTNLERFVETHDVTTSEAVAAEHLSTAQTVLEESEPTGDVWVLAAVLGRTADDRPVAVVSDDRRVRTTARGLGATVTGTIGVVVNAVDRGLDPADARRLVDRLDAQGLHMTGSLRAKADDLIAAASESSE